MMMLNQKITILPLTFGTECVNAGSCLDIKPCINEERQYDDSEVQSEEKDLSPGSNTESCETQVKEAEDETKVAVKMQLHSFVKEEMESSDGSEADGHPQVYGVQVIQPLEDDGSDHAQDPMVEEPLKQENVYVCDSVESMDVEGTDVGSIHEPLSPHGVETEEMHEIISIEPMTESEEPQSPHEMKEEEMHDIISIEPVTESEGQDMFYTLLVKEEL